MISQIKAEVLKIRSTRTTLGLLLGMIAFALLFSILPGLLSHAAQLTGKDNQVNLLGIGAISGIFAALAGIMLVASEYRFGTIRPTFLFSPNRGRVFASKVVAGMLAGFVFGVVAEGLSILVDFIILRARGISIALSGGDFALLLVGALVGAALWGAIGVGLGAIVPNQVAAIILLLAWGFVVENLVFGLLPSVGRYLPVHAQDSMIGLSTPHLLAAGLGAVVLLAWTAGLGVIGLSLLRRRDVN
ncbi:MAG: hypothetical protein EPN30_06080 [Actinomycetota bacterium]|nr:MAG: hypothetical protein EPN30_06080 [Actinomycetota bacterium]